ncbi:signal peptidase II [Marmoricola sp. OAE513]|uniref:signal peptidase II n=1 Tax=Marmoricola sp. OAE513 TaxID=2817894 RepID=UPI001AE6E701
MQAARGTSLTSDGESPQPTEDSGSRLVPILAIGLVALLVDLGTKVLAVERLADGEPRHFIGSLLQLHLTRNPGAAFSTGTSMTPWISAFGCVALVVVLVVARRVRTPLWTLAFGLLIAGIAGNLVDRFFRDPGPLRGHVIDFLELPNWPIFNIADICINIAAGLIILQSLRGVPLAGREEKSEKSS